MSKKSIGRERRKLKKLKEKYIAGDIAIEDIENNYQSWKANAKRGNTRNLLIKMDNYYHDLFEEVIS